MQPVVLAAEEPISRAKTYENRRQTRFLGGRSPHSGTLDPMTFEEMESLLDYNYWARDRILEAVSVLTLEQFTRPMRSSFSSVRDTIAHICGAESIWLSRWSGEPLAELPKPDRLANVAAARQEWERLEAGLRGVLRSLGPQGVERAIEYKDLRGNPHADLFWHMLQHVVNHGSYHRGQVTTMLRQLGAQPPKPMDLIAFYRERQPGA
jgi:uncharacterized damage-inducible protein DinB